MHTRRDLFAGAGAAALALGSTAVAADLVPTRNEVVERAPLIPSPKPPLPPTELEVQWVEDSGRDELQRGDMAIVHRLPGFRHNGHYIYRSGYVVFAQMKPEFSDGPDGVQIIHREHWVKGMDPEMFKIMRLRCIHDFYYPEDGRWVLAEPWTKRKAVTS